MYYRTGMRKLLSSLAVFVFVFFTITVSQVSAKVFMQETGDVTVAKNEIVNDDLFVGAKNVNLDGTVNGDVFIGAENVRITGIINGNLHIGASVVNLGGRIRGNVYVGSGNVTVSKSVIGGSLLIGGGSVTVDKDTVVSGSLLSGAGQITIDSPVKRNVFIGAGSAQINSTVGGELRVGGGSITLGPSAKIAKDFYYATGDEQGKISISDTATISGVTHKGEYSFAQRQKLDSLQKEIPSLFRTFRLVTELLSFFGAIIIGFLSLKFFKKYFSESAGFISNSFLKSIGIGLLVTVLIIPVLIILAITGVGAPLAGLLFLLFLLYTYLTKIVVGIALGIWLSAKFNWKKITPFASLTLGIFAIYVLKIVPVIGALTSLVVLWGGLGAFALKLISQKE
jgi:hypothetical protein